MTVRKTASAVVLAMLLLVAPGVAKASVPAPYTPSNGTVFNNPKGTKAQQLAIITTIDRAIDASPKGSTIRMAQYLFDIDSTANKLVAAYKRGVHVQVLVDDNVKTAQITRVRAALGTSKATGSFVIKCHHSCMANTASVMHAKFYTFSTAGSASLVSMVSSANPYTGNTFKSWNDIQTVVGDRTLYTALGRYFVDMLKDQNNLNYYKTAASGKFKLYMFPRAPIPGVQTVALLDVLNHVSCTGVASGYGKGGRTVIRVAMWGWTSARLDIARRLWTLHDQGCDVMVVDNAGVTSTSVSATLLKRSVRYGVMPLYDTWVDPDHNGIAAFYMHLKLVTINGKWFGHPNAKVTYTGSQNFTGPATRVNNDMILRMQDAATHDRYVRNLDFIRTHYTKLMTRVPPVSAAGQKTDAEINAAANADGAM